MKFREHVPDEPTNNTEPKKLILKRESCSCDSADRHSSDTSSRRSKRIGKNPSKLMPEEESFIVYFFIQKNARKSTKRPENESLMKFATASRLPS